MVISILGDMDHVLIKLTTVGNTSYTMYWTVKGIVYGADIIISIDSVGVTSDDTGVNPTFTADGALPPIDVLSGVTKQKVIIIQWRLLKIPQRYMRWYKLKLDRQVLPIRCLQEIM